MLERRKAIATLMANRPKDLFVVPGLGLRSRFSLRKLTPTAPVAFPPGSLNSCPEVLASMASVHSVDEMIGPL